MRRIGFEHLGSRRWRTPRRDMGQTLVEYTLLTAALIPLAYWFAQRLLVALYLIYQHFAWDLTGPGV